MSLRSPSQTLRILATALLIAIAGQVAGAEVWPGDDWATSAPSDVGLDAALLNQARDYALTGEGSGLIARGDKVVLGWGDPQARYDLKSTTKSIGATALGVALLDGKLALSDQARKYLPDLGTPPEENDGAGWCDEITILHLATQTAGFEKPGGFGKLLFRPGSRWCYSDGGPNWLADCVTQAYGRDVDELMFERIFTPIGITRDDLVWRKHSYRPKMLDGVTRREFGSGVSANVDAMARVGLLYLRGGIWNGKRLLPAEFIKQAGTTVGQVVGLTELDEKKDYGNASDHYGLLWWNNADGTLAGVPRDAYWSWGLYDSLIVVIPSLDIVVARAGKSWPRTAGAGHYDVLRPVLEPIAKAAGFNNAEAVDDLLERISSVTKMPSQAVAAQPAPYPPSPVIKGIRWAPKSEIVRRARGGDNWPLTWGDDDALYTAYGDGKGFEPLIDKKLSLGLCRLTGGPTDFVAENLRAPTIEQLGDGPRGRKASSLLMVDGVLYLLARNAGNAQLASSRDHGASWTWNERKFTHSFGCPTFLNFGRNYEDARDQYVYIYSHDNDSAYEPADGVVLARTHRDHLGETYQYFVGLTAEGEPNWTNDITDAKPVFKNAGRCYRTTVSYSAGLKRYLMVQVLPGDDPRFAGGFGIYDAPEPWGPLDDRVFRRPVGHGPRRNGESADEMDARRRPDDSPRFFRRRPLFGTAGRVAIRRMIGRQTIACGARTDSNDAAALAR